MTSVYSLGPRTDGGAGAGAGGPAVPDKGSSEIWAAGCATADGCCTGGACAPEPKMRVYSLIGLVTGAGTDEAGSSKRPPLAGAANGSDAPLPAFRGGAGGGGAELLPPKPPCINIRVNSPGSVPFWAGGGGAAGEAGSGVFGRCTNPVRPKSGFDGRSALRAGSGEDFRSGGLAVLKKRVNSPSSEGGFGEAGLGSSFAAGRESFGAAAVPAINMRVNSPGSLFAGSDFGGSGFEGSGF